MPVLFSDAIPYNFRMKKLFRNLLKALLILFFLAGAVLTFRIYYSSHPDYPGSFDYEAVPAYESQPYIEINGNRPFFTDDQLRLTPFEEYGQLDSLGRCTYAFALVSRDTMPDEERGEIRDIIPSGWKWTKYDFVPYEYLYNRCHLIAYALTGENANPNNLITGTRYLNYDGMRNFEGRIASYIYRTDHSVLYRVTPVFSGSELVARGVLLEAQSVEDDQLSFCVFCYNVQPGVNINYATGESWADPEIVH